MTDTQTQPLAARVTGADLAAAGFPTLPSEAPQLDEQCLPPLAASRFLDRDRLADLLRKTNLAAGNPLDATTLDAIRTTGRFIIAGQQPGLLLGPMYTLLKAVTAVKLAARLAPRAGIPVIPAFWIASEDHDIAEVSHVLVNGRRIVTPHDSCLHTAVGRVGLTDFRDGIIDEFAAAVADLPHRDWAIELLRSVRWDNFADTFAELMAKLLPGRLVLIDPMKLRELTAPVMSHLAARRGELDTALRAGAATLTAHGFTPPLGHVTFFQIDDTGRRTPLSNPQINNSQINPARLSPSAAIRPLVQDAILPVIATVAGPGELLYLWQIDPLYNAAGITRSRLVPRMSATLIDSTLVRRAQRFGLTAANLLTVQKKLAEYDPQHLGEEDRDLADVERAASALLDRLAALDDRIDDGAKKIVTKARESIEFQVTKTVQRLREQRLERLGAGRRNLARIADAVYPHGKLQERIVSPLDALARWGPGLLKLLVDDLDPPPGCHAVVEIGAGDRSGELA